MPADDPQWSAEMTQPIYLPDRDWSADVTQPIDPAEIRQYASKARIHRRHRRPPGRQGSGKDVLEAQQRRKKSSFWRELPILVGVALVLVFLIQQFLARVYVIPSGSMEQTLHGCPGCAGDRILVEKVSYYFSKPAPGDVVVFKGPASWTQDEVQSERSDNAAVRFLQQIGSVVGLAPPDEKDFVKRVIAIGGQTVQCCDEQQRVLVNGVALNEPYIYWDDGTPQQEPFEPIRVPEGMLWVMGDNRNNSCDSRCQGGGGVAGLVPVENVVGKAQVIVLPPARWGGVDDHDPQAIALNAPAWQQGLPFGVGFAAAWPVLWISRRLGKTVTERLGGRRHDGA
jgi:signal peptidase I